MRAKDAARYISRQWFAVLSLSLATFLCGCTSRILKPEGAELSHTRQSVQGQKQLEITYSVYAGSKYSKQELAKAFTEVCASHGINAHEAKESSGPSKAHVALYELEGKLNNPSLILLGVATLFLAPICEESGHPIELHVLQPVDGDTGRPRVFQGEYLIEECTWVPTIARDWREQGQLRDTALRQVLAKAVRSTLLVP